ncbi:uncharacterized protein LOC117322375 [Pecten maximus]|uniref:uncharacterized protein LOC117322375 n=1 Tax=Pecten maximus TaxID=6579 RepID=UPI001458869F|nr:uncharacterized protein LOC117322375 [Pecten maximus]
MLTYDVSANMAEGGQSSDPPFKDSTRSNLVYSHLMFIECPICLEQLRQPKCLPCRHCFCEECLSIYIVKETSKSSGTAASFTCPVCRKLTHPVDKSEDKTNWAKQFPTDRHAVERIRLANHPVESFFCSPCQKKRQTTHARFWCKATSSSFCESCKVDFHDMVHTECDIVDLTNWFDRLNMNEECEQHHRKKNYYCEDHKFIGCIKCLTAGHKDCKALTSLKDVCAKLKNESLLDKSTRSLQLGVTEMESLIQEFDLQLQTNADDRDTALKSIEDVQKKIEHRIAEKKKDVTDDMIAKYKEIRDHLKVSSQKCERLKAAMQNTLESAAEALQRNDFINTVLFYRRGQTEIESYHDLAEEMQKSLFATRIEHELDSNWDISSVLCFGKIAVRKDQRIVHESIKNLKKDLTKCKLKEIGKVNRKSSSDTYDCRGYVYLPDGRLVVGDHYKQKLKLIDAKGHVVDELDVNGLIWDVCIVDNRTIAVLTEKDDGIHVVTITPYKLVNSAEIKLALGSCSCIAYRNGEFIVSQGCYVYSVKSDGTVHKIHQYDRTVSALSYDPTHGHLFISYFTITGDRAIIGMLSRDNIYTDLVNVGIVECVSGMDVHKEGNIYVCGSNTLVQMSGDGKHIRLLTKMDNIADLHSISVCGDRIAMTNCSSEKNYIQVFQLE